MAYLDVIITFGAALTAISGVVMLAKKIITFFSGLANNIQTTIEYVSGHINDVNKINDIERHTRENYLMCLRLTIMSSEMPLGERIVAGKKYIAEGGNGEVKKYCENELRINDVQKD